MSDDRMPPRLVEADDALARRLLESARAEAPTEERVRAWMAVAPAAGGGLAARSGLAKVAGAVAGLAGIGAAIVGLSTMHRGRQPVVGPAAAIEAPAAIPPAPAAEPPPAADTGTAPVAAPPAAAPSSQVHVPSPSSSAPSLEAELGRLRLARARLAEGDASGALRGVASYEQDFPHGAFRPEAEAIAIDALVAAGRDAEARARAQRFLKVYGNSPQAERMMALVERLAP